MSTHYIANVLTPYIRDAGVVSLMAYVTRKRLLDTGHPRDGRKGAIY